MRKLVAIAAFCASSHVVCADFYIHFHSSWGIYSPSGTTGILPALNDTAVVQLIALGQNNLYDS